MVQIFSVDDNSHAHKAGILAGDFLLSVNGNKISDVIDYKFYIFEKKLTLNLKRGGNEFEVGITKAQYADIGLGFETYLMDKKKTCKNKCVFCFIDQMPREPKLRDTLYFKDDDERLSFLQGNYITLTNLDDAHIDRIIKMKISPVNISVHTTNPDLRVKMMGNPEAGKVLSYMYRLAESNITLNTQIVLCKNHNDREELNRTLCDLCSLCPTVNSIAVVPAGLTVYREKLCRLETFSPEECREIISQIEGFAAENEKKYGRRGVYAADEIFLKAETNIPEADYYEDFPQIENGVGMIRDHVDSFYAALKGFDYAGLPPKKISFATGSAFYPVLKTEIADIQKLAPQLELCAYEIKNDFFGHDITVAGLVTGGDLVRQLAPYKANLGEVLCIPKEMLNADGLFLDNMTIKQAEDVLSIKIEIVKSSNFFEL